MGAMNEMKNKTMIEKIKRGDMGMNWSRKI